MRYSKVWVAAGTLLLAAGPVRAQDVIAQRSLSLPLALAIAQGALGCAGEHGWHVSITMVDQAGQDMLFLRDPAAAPHTVENSRRKAYTARTTKMTSAAFADLWWKQDHTRVPQATLPGMIALAGGVPVKAGEDTIGAIGISGSPGGENDELCAKQALDGVAARLR